MTTVTANPSTFPSSVSFLRLFLASCSWPSSPLILDTPKSDGESLSRKRQKDLPKPPELSDRDFGRGSIVDEESSDDLLSRDSSDKDSEVVVLVFGSHHGLLVADVRDVPPGLAGA